MRKIKVAEISHVSAPQLPTFDANGHSNLDGRPVFLIEFKNGDKLVIKGEPNGSRQTRAGRSVVFGAKLMESVSDQEVLKQMGRIMAVDIFIGNNDRWEVALNSDNKRGGIVNSSNLLFQKGG